MTIVSMKKLTDDIQSRASLLIDEAGLVPQATDRPLEAADLLFYISNTSMPMADFLKQHGLFMDYEGLHFDLAQFGAIRALADKVIAEREADNLNGVWRQYGLSSDEDIDNNGGYILSALASIEALYGSPS